MQNLKWLRMNRCAVSTLPEDLEKFPKLVSSYRELVILGLLGSDCKCCVARRECIERQSAPLWYTVEACACVTPH